jgi:putative transposase
MDVLAGCNFFTAEVLSWSGLVTYYLVFFIELESRRVWIGGITRHPESCWMQQVARNATLEGEGYLKGCRYVLHDRDKKFWTDFCQTLAAGDVKCVVLPARRWEMIVAFGVLSVVCQLIFWSAVTSPGDR